ncbi:MAG: TlpA disulfide reductase family protein [Nocardioides sp.]
MSARRRTLPLLDPVVTVAVILVVGAAAGCTSDIGSSGDQGFVSGQGIITVVAEAERSAPGEVAGETIDGEPLSLSDYAGQVVVVNVWGSWCVPCRTEAPMLAEAARDLESEDVAFLGIDSRDSDQDNARAFVRTFDIPYPSIYDQEGRTLLAFRGTLTPSSIPSTVVIDREGRVAASVLGEITRTTLDELVEEAS